ncbi:MAG TPA: hypothetical protein VIR60_10800 [Gammaproteobacteria bacterium]
MIVGANASNTSKNWARWYAQSVANSFGIGLGGDQGVVVGGFGGRGDGNVKLTRMPAILVEPLFANNPAHAEWMRSAAGQERLARILADSIQRCFPDGGLIGFSVGHKYKTSSPNDRGAAVYGGGTEADCAEAVLQKAAALLQNMPAATARSLAIQIGNREVWRYEADPDCVVRWDETRGILFIDEPGALESETPTTPRPVGRRRAQPAAAAAVGTKKKTSVRAPIGSRTTKTPTRAGARRR